MLKQVNAYFIGGPADGLECPIKEEHWHMPPRRVRWYDGTMYEHDEKTSRRACHVYRISKEQPA